MLSLFPYLPLFFCEYYNIHIFRAVTSADTEDVSGRGNGKNEKQHGMLSEMHPINPSLRIKWGVGMAGKGNLRSKWFGDSAENLGIYLEGHGCICLSAFYPPRELVIEGF